MHIKLYIYCKWGRGNLSRLQTNYKRKTKKAIRTKFAPIALNNLFIIYKNLIQEMVIIKNLYPIDNNLNMIYNNNRKNLRLMFVVGSYLHRLLRSLFLRSVSSTEDGSPMWNRLYKHRFGGVFCFLCFVYYHICAIMSIYCGNFSSDVQHLCKKR